MATTTYAAIRYPVSTDSPNLAQYYQNLASDVDQKVRLIVANPTARNALSAKYDGMEVFEQSTRRKYMWNATTSAWDYAGGAPPPIVALTIAGGWSASASGAPGVYKDASGVARFVGGVNNASTYNPNVSATMCTIPAGYRPANLTYVLIQVAPSASILLQINIDGTVVTFSSGATSVPAGSGHWLGAGSGWHTSYAGTVPLA